MYRHAVMYVYYVLLLDNTFIPEPFYNIGHAYQYIYRQLLHYT